MMIYCACRDSGGRWGLAVDDRHCGLCGKARDGIEPLGLVLSRGPVPTIAGYLLSPDRKKGFMTVELRFRAAGRLNWPLAVSWEQGGGEELKSLQRRLTSTGEFGVQLQSGRWTSASGLAATGVLRVGPEEGGELTRAFAVRVYTVGDDKGEVWLSSDQGGVEPHRVKDRDATRLALYRGDDSRSVSSFVEFRLPAEGEEIPVAWDDLIVAHPAATVELVRPSLAGTSARGRVIWDLDRLDDGRDDLAVGLDLRPFGLTPRTVVQPMTWRPRKPLSFLPPALLVEGLPTHRPQAFQVLITNTDREPIEMLGVEANGAAWLREVSPPSRNGTADPPGPRTLAPGESTTLAVELDPGRLAGGRPPYRGSLEVRMKGRHRQRYSVWVAGLRRRRVIEGPLLVIPGPPRVVVAALDRRGAVVARPTRAGSRGLAPEEIGVHPLRYAQAAYSRKDVEAALREIIAAAEALAREECLWDFNRVRLVRPVWAPAELRLGDVEIVEWADGPSRTEDEAPSALAHVGAWEVVVAFPPDPGEIPVVGRRWRAGPESLGAVVRDWLVADSKDRARAKEAFAGPHPIKRSCEEFLADLADGPREAWYHLGRAARIYLGESRHGRDKQELLEGLARARPVIAERIARHVAERGGDRTVCRLAGPLARGLADEPLVRSMEGSQNISFRISPPDRSRQLDDEGPASPPRPT